MKWRGSPARRSRWRCGCTATSTHSHAAIDHADPAPPIATIVGNQATRTVEQYVQLVAHLRRQGDGASLAKAQAILDEAFKLHPDAAPLRLAQVEVLLDAGAAQRALQTLEALNDDVQADAAAHLLRARALIELERWAEAEAAARAVLSARPDLRDALFLMGQIHEHFERWKEAAEAYRRARP